jgi:hypothetical protein
LLLMGLVLLSKFSVYHFFHLFHLTMALSLLFRYTAPEGYPIRHPGLSSSMTVKLHHYRGVYWNQAYISLRIYINNNTRRDKEVDKVYFWCSDVTCFL